MVHSPFSPCPVHRGTRTLRVCVRVSVVYYNSARSVADRCGGNALSSTLFCSYEFSFSNCLGKNFSFYSLSLSPSLPLVETHASCSFFYFFCPQKVVPCFRFSEKESARKKKSVPQEMYAIVVLLYQVFLVDMCYSGNGSLSNNQNCEPFDKQYVFSKESIEMFIKTCKTHKPPKSMQLEWHC